jgi:hypothetical protein
MPPQIAVSQCRERAPKSTCSKNRLGGVLKLDSLRRALNSESFWRDFSSTNATKSILMQDTRVVFEKVQKK